MRLTDLMLQGKDSTRRKQPQLHERRRVKCRVKLIIFSNLCKQLKFDRLFRGGGIRVWPLNKSTRHGNARKIKLRDQVLLDCHRTESVDQAVEVFAFFPLENINLRDNWRIPHLLAKE